MSEHRSARTTAAVGVAVAGGALALRTLARRDAARALADPSRELLSPQDVDHETRTVRSDDGAELHVRVFGPAGAPTIVFCHGWVCTWEMWWPQIRGLSEDHRVVVFDQRGHGRSTHGGDGFTCERLGDDLAAVIDVTDDDCPLVVVWHSMGAMAMVAWAERHPQQVRRTSAVVLASTGVDGLVRDASFVPRLPAQSRARAVIGRLFLGFPAALGRPSPLSARLFRYVALSPSAGAAQVDFCTRMFLSCGRRSRIGWGRMMASLDLSEAISALDVPALVVVGTADRMTPTVHAERLVEALPRAEPVVELPGIGHMATVEAAGDVTQLVRDMVTRHAPPRRSTRAVPRRTTRNRTEQDVPA